jgi:cation diffusion facilitator family transporter
MASPEARDPKEDNLLRARQVAAWALLVTILLAGGKGVVGWLVGSSALMADALHSGTDVVARATTWFGLLMAARPATKRFPYGFYRAETLGALVASAAIIYLGASFIWQSVQALGEPMDLRLSGAGLAAAAVSMAVGFVLHRVAKKAGRETGSQSLAVTAEDARTDVLASGAVFVAVLCSRYRIAYVESVVTLLIAAVVLRAGLASLWVSLLSLMDASIDPELEREVAGIIADIPGVREVEKIHARRSGPFYFVDGHISVRPTMDVMRSHALAHRAQAEVRASCPRVEGVILHIEPYHGEAQKVLVPVESDAGLQAPLSEHFGRAPFFLVVALEEGEPAVVETLPNEFRRKAVRAGLAVIREFVKKRELDVVLVREIGEIAFHGLRDSFVDLFKARDATAGEALRAYAAGELRVLPEPTHTSEQRLEDGPPEA